MQSTNEKIPGNVVMDVLQSMADMASNEIMVTSTKADEVITLAARECAEELTQLTDLMRLKIELVGYQAEKKLKGWLQAAYAALAISVGLNAGIILWLVSSIA